MAVLRKQGIEILRCETPFHGKTVISLRMKPNSSSAQVLYRRGAGWKLGNKLASGEVAVWIEERKAEGLIVIFNQTFQEEINRSKEENRLRKSRRKNHLWF